MIVANELHTGNSETPDVIGFKGSSSIVVECKTSRGDFLADGKKWHRRHNNGMGDLFFFAIPADDRFIKPVELNEEQGLLYVCERSVVPEKIPKRRDSANKHAEIIYLVSVIRRLKISTAVYVVADEPSGAEPGKGEKI